jgi:hypothetical protein
MEDLTKMIKQIKGKRRELKFKLQLFSNWVNREKGTSWYYRYPTKTSTEADDKKKRS